MIFTCNSSFPQLTVQKFLTIFKQLIMENWYWDFILNTKLFIVPEAINALNCISMLTSKKVK